MTDINKKDIAKDRADWLIDSVACATQNRMFLRGDPECDAVACDAILMNGEKAIRVATEKLQHEITRLRAENEALQRRVDELEPYKRTFDKVKRIYFE